ncbi:hypothetical protein BH24DEI2_BH24DEI2_15600 [soil metagenome]
MQGVVIRPMLFNDVDGVVEWLVQVPLWQRYGLSEAGMSETFKRALKRGEWLIVAEVKSAKHASGSKYPCGFAWCQASAAFGQSGYLRLLGVEAAFSGQGVGAQLLGEAERFVAAASNDLFLLVADFNTAAQRFY